ncbi:MAG: N-acetylmuramoyl-L-alanine amidase [Gemmatimonadaceae bacterium]|nr:N-acetylmuramoyl-L-alanine amidase [Gemmatimonadaceae bacterium]
MLPLPLATSCAVRQASAPAPRPAVIPHSAWAQSPPVGYAADATRRNKAAGDSLTFRDVTITVLGTDGDPAGATTADVARLRLRAGSTVEERTVREGTAFRWNGYRIAIVAIHNTGELGAGLVALEVATVASLPPHIAASDSAGGAAMRLRIPHRITHVTLHHTGDSRTLEPHENPAVRLRNLQAWGARDRNWWDVPYHYLMGLEGQVYEGRDHRFAGETNTTYNPEGHFLISIIGNYEQQEPTPAQIESIVQLMAWAVTEFDVPLDRIGGHYHYANSGCPGKHLRKYLEDGTFRRMVAERVGRGG